MDAINYIKMSTHNKEIVNDMIHNNNIQMDNTKNVLNNKIGEVQTDMKNKASYDHVNAYYAKKEDVFNKFNEYTRQIEVDSKMSQLNKHAEDNYLTKNAAYNIYANKGSVFDLKNSVTGLEGRQALLSKEMESISNTLPSYVTRGDLTTYARYTDFVDLSSSVSRNAKDMTKNYQTVSDFIGVQSEINKSFLDKDVFIQKDILNMKNDHDDLVGELGNYMNADTINNLLHNSYTPINTFNVVDGNVKNLQGDLKNIGDRTKNSETILDIMKSRLCLVDPVNKNDVCLVGGDFALLKEIMVDYYGDLEKDAGRLRELEESRKESDNILKKIRDDLIESERKRKAMEEANQVARDKLRSDAKTQDEAISDLLSAQIYNITKKTTEQTDKLRDALILEEEKSDTERIRMERLNDQLTNLNKKLGKVEAEDNLQNQYIKELKKTVEGFQEEKKKLEMTIQNKSSEITRLDGILSMQGLQIVRQESTIKDQEDLIGVCKVEKDKCVDTDLPTCRSKRMECEEEYAFSGSEISGLGNTVSILKAELYGVQEEYKTLSGDFNNRITPQQCDDIERNVYKYSFYKGGDEYLFDADIVARVAADDVEQDNILDYEKRKEINRQYNKVKDQNIPLANKLAMYDKNSSMFKWKEPVSQCKDFSKELNDLNNTNGELRTMLRDFGVNDV
jgi:hypothetical protein